MKGLKIVTLLILCATSSFAQQKGQTIKVKKSDTFSKALLDSTFTHLIVVDVNNQKVNSPISSFDMIVHVPNGMAIAYGPDSIVYTKKPVSYRSHSAYFTVAMTKAWKENPSGQIVYFQNIFVKGADKKEHKLPDFTYRKP